MTTLIEIIQTNLENAQNLKITLTIAQITYIKTVLKNSPHIFDKIVNDIDSILDDNTISIHKIPKIITLISDIYHNNALLNDMEQPDNIIRFTEFTINSILDSDLFVLPNLEKKIIKELVDYSLELLGKQIAFPNTERQCCWGLF